MAYIFDSLGYAKRLRDGGVPLEQAEAHAEAARDFIMVELATKADVLGLKTELGGRITELRASVTELEGKLGGRITELQADFRELRSSVETLSLRLTVRLGAMLVVGIGALAAILKLA
ncbi:MAG: hypothetical protein JO328_06855 [Hyphomicrobiales bacterium]|nr:hypothetical protein [Hyphomicrobiales bacterium]MBV9426988.1 hypothetical protein [Bradyrhizobiaceae bacterium]